MHRKYLGYGVVMAALIAAPVAQAATPEVAAAETTVNISAAFMHTQYHENLTLGDDENGYTPGFGVGASALLATRQGWNPDLYTSLSYDFSAGNLDYGGHYAASGQPVNATDNAVFNRIEARIGLGYEFNSGIELIPFVAAGYQAWNRNINKKNAIGTDEFYHSALIGGGLKLDVPLTPTIVASVSAEMLALVGGGIAVNNFNINEGFGPSAQERFAFGLDDAIGRRLHLIATAYLQHFNYSGTKPDVYGIYEPLSTTTQFGVNIGVAYSFN